MDYLHFTLDPVYKIAQNILNHIGITNVYKFIKLQLSMNPNFSIHDLKDIEFNTDLVREFWYVFRTYDEKATLAFPPSEACLKEVKTISTEKIENILKDEEKLCIV